MSELKQILSNLNEKQKTFCKEYIIDFNGTQAAIRAGYSKKTANEQASQHLAKLNIQQYIKYLIDERSKRTEITADRVIEEYAKIAFIDSKDLYDKDGNLKSINEMDNKQSATIQEINVHLIERNEQRSINEIKYKLHSKIQALDALAKHTGVYEKDNEQKKPEIVIGKINYITPGNGDNIKTDN